jgi:hypothetical protein
MYVLPCSFFRVARLKKKKKKSRLTFPLTTLREEPELRGTFSFSKATFALFMVPRSPPGRQGSISAIPGKPLSEAGWKSWMERRS